MSTLNPWTTIGPVNYKEQSTNFKTSPINNDLLERWTQITKTKPHTWLRRGIVFSHQDLDKILNCVEQGIPIYIYTGRGPSSESMHLGHLVPFEFTKYLQDALNCIVIIQMSDDEKFIFKDGSTAQDLKKFNNLTYKNAKDIIACGFDKNKTYIFSNLESNIKDLYFNNILISKAINMNTIKGTYGIGEIVEEPILEVVKNALDDEKKKDEPNIDNIRCYEKLIKNNEKNKVSNSIGQCMWPVFQCGPAFATSFRDIFIRAISEKLKLELPPNINKNLQNTLKELQTFGASQNMCCLVPMAIDQAPYFRVARNISYIMKHPRPAVIYSKFLPGLQQADGKMSSTNTNNTIFLDMNEKNIVNLIKKHAFSGGQKTLEEHKKYGGNIEIDTCYQYLTYFLDDDEMLEDIAKKYGSGKMTSGELKMITSKIIVDIVKKHQDRKILVSDELVMEYFDGGRVLDVGGVY